ncbi:ABC transporter ATP-binding protein [Paenibacillus sp. S02]|uniref:ABC transporter ATP-binding protein n=1 Tax=Paenibacillus sp. S02 TaxID=2823904 RepID=UPI001C6518DF|nr:ABC transporter ATP-binding protein [Paenibacillus sp. S02]QYK69604.1 Vitamin B12 import ATP-binding protein BtuD [Paenibacillus sp. S02]
MIKNELAIEIGNITKTYKVYNKPYHKLLEIFNLGKKNTEINALKGISFKVEKGKTCGIVGPNGSGKSTLLQILTGILQPTSGYFNVKGRISALLELGAGFNPDYTGRENIFLYASILGVEKKEIETKIDEIIEFAQIGDFIDRSVKTYSSGMYVRLAFAVAINVDPDILIVDEALAVGDESFQRKCFRKFEELKEKGVTILFVTHSLGLVKQFCDEAVLIYKGELIEQGHPNHVINVYTKLIAEMENGVRGTKPAEKGKDIPILGESKLLDSEQAPSEYRYGNGEGKIISFKLDGENGNKSRIYRHGEKITISLKLQYYKDTYSSLAAYTIKTVSGVEITGTNTSFEGLDLKDYKKDDILNVVFTQNTILNAGDYVVSLGFIELVDDNIVVMDRRYDVLTFKVAETKKAAGLVDPKVEINVSKVMNNLTLENSE